MANEEGGSPAKAKKSLKKKKSGKTGAIQETPVGGMAKAKVFYYSWSPEFKEFIRYLCFVALFCAVIFMPRNADPFFMTKGLEDIFKTNEFDYNIDFERMNTRGQALKWFEDVLIPNLLPTTDYNGAGLTNIEKGFVGIYNKRLGTARVRTVKVEEGTCNVPETLQNKIQECYPSLSDSNIDESSFSRNVTTILGGRVTSNVLNAAFMASADAAWYSPTTKLTYPGSGQVIDFDSSLENVTAIWDSVKATEWIDSSTRAVFVNVNFYNANVDLVSAAKFSIEFSSAGAIFTSTQIRCLPLIRPVRVLKGDGATSLASLTFTLELIFFGMVIMYILNEIRLLQSVGISYLKNFWNQVTSISDPERFDAVRLSRHFATCVFTLLSLL